VSFEKRDENQYSIFKECFAQLNLFPCIWTDYVANDFLALGKAHISTSVTDTRDFSLQYSVVFEIFAKVRN
jgi:hypothetical protein